MISFILTWITFPCLWVYLLKKANLSILEITIPTFLFCNILIFQYLGFPILYFEADEYRSEFVNNRQILTATFFYNIFSTTQLLIGFLIGKKVFGDLQWTKSKKPKNQIGKKQNLLIILFGILCVLVLAVYLNKIGLKNTTLSLIGQHYSKEEIAFLRSEMGNNFLGKYYWYELFMRSGLLLVVIFFLNQLIINPKKPCNWLWFFIFGAFLVLSCMMAAEKAPIVFSILACMVGAVWIRYKGSIPPYILFVTGSLVLLTLLFSYQYFIGEKGFKPALESIISRTFTGQLQATYHYVEIFPNTIPWLNGASLPNPGGIFEYTPFNLAQELSAEVFPQDTKAGIVGSMPSVFWVEFYANFGICGLLGLPIFVGFFLYFINFIIFAFPYNSLSVAFFSWATVHYAVLAGTFLSNYFFDLKLLVLGTFVLVVLLSQKKKNI